MSEWNNDYTGPPNMPNLPPQPSRQPGGRIQNNNRSHTNNRRGGLNGSYRFHGGGQPMQQQQAPNHYSQQPLYYPDSYGPPTMDGPSLKRARMEPNHGNYYGPQGGSLRGYNGGSSVGNMKFNGGGYKNNGGRYNQQNNMNNNGNNNLYHHSYHHHHQSNGGPVVKTRVYSDFRISRVKIGLFEVNETKPMGNISSFNRDSRLRLYFRNSNDHQTNPPSMMHMSVRDKALTEPDRLSISIFQGTKRIVIPVQEGLEKVNFNRKEGYFRIKSLGWALFEEVDPSGGVNGGKPAGQFRKCEDFTQDQLNTNNGVIEVWIDKANPLPMEPKWTRGNLQDYIDARSKFRTQNVLEVDDPENIIDFDSVVDLWTRESSIGTRQERDVFVKSQLGRLDYMLELTSKILAPPHYYVSRNAAASAAAAGNQPNGSASNGPLLENNPVAVAQILETGQIPALISPSVNVLIATTYHLAMLNGGGDENEKYLVSLLKAVVYQVPEPILWRSLDGLFGKRNEPLNFKPELVMEKIASKTQEREATIATAKSSLSSSTTADSSSTNTTASKANSDYVDQDVLVTTGDRKGAQEKEQAYPDEVDMEESVVLTMDDVFTEHDY